MRTVFANPWMKRLVGLFLLFLSAEIFALPADTIGNVATKLTANIENLTKLLTAAAYVTGATMFFIAIFQFRQHKENPTQTPLSKPMMFLGIAAALLFFPTLVDVTAVSIFGTGAKTAGASGTGKLGT